MFVAFFIGFIPVVAIGQDVIYDINSLSSKKSIVREFKANEFVIFNEQTNPSFVLVNLNTVTAQRMDCNNIHVTDFEIYQDNVYFCGSDATGPVAGMFDIYGAFGGTSSIEYIYFPPSPNCDTLYGMDHITGFKKIEVLNNGTTTHMIMICEATQSVYPGQINRGVVDVFHNGFEWRMDMYQENSAVYYYDDVAVTDTKVIVIGHKNQSNGIYYSAFNYPVANTSLFNGFSCKDSTYYYYYAGGSEFIIDSLSEVAIEHIRNDMFATVCYGKYRNSTITPYSYGTVLCLFGGVGTPANFYAVDPYSYVYRDLRYNTQTESLMLLPGSNSPNLYNGYVEFGLNVPLLTVVSQTSYSGPSGSKYHSLDATNLTYPVGQAILTGTYNGYLRIWRHSLIYETPCTRRIELDRYDVLHDTYSAFFTFYKTEQKLESTNYLLDVKNVNMKRICIAE